MGVDGKGRAGGLARGWELASTSGEQGRRTGRRPHAARFSSGPHHYGGGARATWEEARARHAGVERGGARTAGRNRAEPVLRGRRLDAWGRMPRRDPDAGGEAAPYESGAVEGALRQERCSAAPSPSDLGGA